MKDLDLDDSEEARCFSTSSVGSNFHCGRAY